MTWSLVGPHLKEVNDGATVVHNAERFQKTPDDVQLDADLIGIAEKFEKETGWKIEWTDSANLLAKPEPESKRVIMSIGWIIASDRAQDKRRLAYLTETLRTVRHAIAQIPIQRG